MSILKRRTSLRALAVGIMLSSTLGVASINANAASSTDSSSRNVTICNNAQHWGRFWVDIKTSAGGLITTLPDGAGGGSRLTIQPGTCSTQTYNNWSAGTTFQVRYQTGSWPGNDVDVVGAQYVAGGTAPNELKFSVTDVHNATCVIACFGGSATGIRVSG